MSQRRVVITGLGQISPVGNDVATAWDNLLAGRSGIGAITRFDASELNSQIAGEVRDFDIGEYISAKEARRMDVFIHYGIAAALQAVADAGLDDAPNLDKERVGVNIGAGIGGLPSIETTGIAVQEGGARKINPFFIPGSLINMIAGHVTILKGYKGPSFGMVSACTTGAHSIGDSARMIKYGDADVMIAGGAECTVSPLGLGGFCAARALSTRNDDPKTASRPWDKDRDGFVLSEGAGVMVLEEYEHAKARGAKIYAEVLGYGLSGDAYHITAPSEDGDGGFRSMSAALKRAGISPADIDYINAHGTSTPLGDVAETVAIKRTLGDAAKNAIVNSTKSMTGHLLGGAGGVESVFTALAVAHQKSPPTINLDNPGEGCDLDYCANVARDATIEIAMSNNFGFGGTNGTLVMKKI